MKKYTLILIVSVVLMLFTAAPSLALTRISTQSGNWSATTTWGGNPAPTAGDDVIIQGNFTVTVDIPNAACLTLQLGGSVLNSGTGTVTFTSGSQLTVSGLVNIGPVNSNGTAGSLTMTAGGTLSCEGFTLGRLGTWNAGTGTIVLTATNTVPNNNNLNFNNLTVSGGTTSFSRNVTFSGNMVIQPGGTIDGGANILSLSGNLTNNGTFNGNTGTLTFDKNGNQTISGSGTNNFNLIRVNMGTGIANTLEVLSTNFSAPDPFLTIVNGTFKMSGSFTFANTFFTGPIYNIDPTAGFWINNPNVTVLPQAGNVSVRGLLRLTAGTYNIGTGVDNSLLYVAGSAITIDGGTMHIAGQLTRTNSTATTAYTQTGGVVSVVEQGSTDAVFGGFDLGAVGSTFTVSGGSIMIRNATSAPADFVNLSSVANVTGGTLQIGDAGSASAQVIRIQTTRAIGNLLISGAAPQPVKPTAQLAGSTLTINGNLTAEAGSKFNAGGFNVNIGGNWSNAGTFTPGGNTVTFNGAAAQSVSNAAGETFNNFTLNKPGGTFTLNNSVTIANNASLLSGTLTVGTNTLTFNGPVSGAGSFTSAVTGTVVYGQGSAGQTVLPGNYGNLVFSNFSKTLSTTGTIGIAGTFTPGLAAPHTVAGSTVSFNGGAQSVPPFTFFNLVLAGTGPKTGTGDISVSGNLTVPSGMTFNCPSALNLNGPAHSNGGTITAATLTAGAGAVVTNNGTIHSTADLSGAGSLVQGASSSLTLSGTAGIASLDASSAGNTVTYDGVSQGVVPAVYHHLVLSGSGSPVVAGVATINGNFTLSGSVSVTAANDITVAGTLAILNGSLSTGPHTVVLGPAGLLSEAPGHPVSGTVTATRNVTATDGTESFGNIGADLLLNGTAPGSTVVVRKTGTASTGNGHNSILRWFDITPATNTGLNAGLVFHYDISEVNGQNPALFTLFRSQDNGATWSDLGGTADPVGHTVSLTGINEFSRWTVADTNNSIGNTPTPTTISITPVSKNAGSPTFVMTVNGTGFFSGKSTVLFNGSPRPTTFVSPVQLTASIPATDLLVPGTYPVTIFNSGGGGASNPQSFTVVPAIPVKVLAETAADGSGTVVPAQSLASGSSLTVYAIARDALNNFVSNVQATWSLTGVTGGVVPADLIPAVDGKSALFSAHVTGSAAIQAISGALSVTPTGLITVIPGAAASLRVETLPGGSGIPVPAQSLASGTSVTVYAVARDASGNFVSNPASSWTLESLTGGVAAGDLVASPDGKSAVFAGHVTGTGVIRATGAAPSTVPSGVLTVTAGAPATIGTETAANGSGTAVPAQSLASGTSVTLYSVARDGSGNFVSNLAATWSLEGITGGVLASDLMASPDGKSAVFTAHGAGSAQVRAVSGVLSSTPSGILSVTAGAAAAVRVETLPNGGGSVVPAQSLASGSTLTAYAVARDASGNFVSNISATWFLESITGGVVAGDLVPAPDGKSAVFTGHIVGSAAIRAGTGILLSTASGIITVTAGPAAKVRVETAPNGSGIVVPNEPVLSGNTITVYSITRDALNNFVANVAASSWGMESVTGGVVPGDLVVAPNSKSATFTGNVVGSTVIRAFSGALATTPTGKITVIAGIASKVRVETAPNATGVVVQNQSVVAGSSVTVYANTRDAANNFVANVAGVWSLVNLTGGVAAGDLVASVDSKSATFTAHYAGTGVISAASGVLPIVSSGTITATVQPTLTIQSVAVAGGQSACYNAAQTITVAGNGTAFVVLAGGSATMIAGQNIIYLPGSVVVAGGYMLGTITTTNQFCLPPPVPAVAAATGDEPHAGSVETGSCRVYPNPTEGPFTVEFSGDNAAEPRSVEIFGMRGERVLKSVPGTEAKQLFSLEGYPAGIYLLKFVSGERTGTVKIVRQ